MIPNTRILQYEAKNLTPSTYSKSRHEKKKQASERASEKWLKIETKLNPSRSASSTNWARLSDNENAPQKKRRKKKRPTTPLYDPSNFIRSTPIIFESKSSRKISATLDPSPHPFCLQEKKTKERSTPSNKYSVHHGVHYRVWSCDEREN